MALAGWIKNLNNRTPVCTLLCCSLRPHQFSWSYLMDDTFCTYVQATKTPGVFLSSSVWCAAANPRLPSGTPDLLPERPEAVPIPLFEIWIEVGDFLVFSLSFSLDLVHRVDLPSSCDAQSWYGNTRSPSHQGVWLPQWEAQVQVVRKGAEWNFFGGWVVWKSSLQCT